jgi:hypothetical protein
MMSLAEAVVKVLLLFVGSVSYLLLWPLVLLVAALRSEAPFTASGLDSPLGATVKIDTQNMFHILLHHGNFVCAFSLRELYNNPKFLEDFGPA